MKEERYVSCNGVRVWTESLGDPSHPAILLIGGAGAHAHFWSDSFCSHLVMGGFFVIRYDHRDIGLSDATEQEYEIKRLAEDAIRILDDYDINAAHIVGHSMGGYIAQYLAAYYPSHLLSVTIISSGPIGETPAVIAPQTSEEKEKLYTSWRVMLRNRPTESFEESAAGYMDVWERLNGHYRLEETLARSYTEEIYTRSRYPAGVHLKHLKVMEKLTGALKENSALFAKIQTPICIIHGEEDYLMLPERGGKALSDVLPHAKYVPLPQMGHMLFNLELEKKLSEIILGFLSENS